MAAVSMPDEAPMIWPSASGTLACWACASVSPWRGAASRSSRARRPERPSMHGFRYEVRMSPAPIRVLMVDDHPVVLAGLKALVGAQPDFSVVGEARDGRTALRLANQLSPDVVVMDISLP